MQPIREGPLIQGTGHCQRELRRVNVRYLVFPEGQQYWICLSCGSGKVTKVVEGQEFPTLIKTGTCHYCGEYFNPDDKHLRPTRDHIIPRAKGGPDEEWNLIRWACARCNTKKKDDWPTCPCQKCAAAVLIFRRNL